MWHSIKDPFGTIVAHSEECSSSFIIRGWQGQGRTHRHGGQSVNPVHAISAILSKEFLPPFTVEWLWKLNNKKSLSSKFPQSPRLPHGFEVAFSVEFLRDFVYQFGRGPSAQNERKGEENKGFFSGQRHSTKLTCKTAILVICTSSVSLYKNNW